MRKQPSIADLLVAKNNEEKTSKILRQEKSIPVGSTTVNLSSEVYNGEIGDTKVFIAENYLCSIAGPKVEEFTQALKDLVDDFRI